MKRKNIVMIMTDDQGYWTLGCAGNLYFRALYSTSQSVGQADLAGRMV